MSTSGRFSRCRIITPQRQRGLRNLGCARTVFIARKHTESEQGTLADDDVAFDEGESHRLLAELVAAAERSPMSELPAGRADLNALLLSLRGAAASPTNCA